MKKIIIISSFLLLSEIISGQNFISLGGMIGKEYTQSDMDTLEYYATQLRNLFPEADQRDQFKVYDYDLYIHNDVMSGSNEISEIFEGLINERNADNHFPYYLLIARFVTQGSKMAYRVFLNLPTENLGPCNTPLFRDAINAELFQSAQNPVELESGLSARLSTDIIKKCYKIIDRLKCCAYSRELEEDCSFCMLTQEEVIAKLKEEGYFDFEEVLSITSSGTYEVEMQDKVYPNLDFNKNIIFKNGTELYSLTDVLDQLMGDIDNYNVSIDLYDDSPGTQQFLCYEEQSEQSSFRSNQEGLTTQIKVINYQQKPKVLLKFEVIRDGNYTPLPVYFYDISNKFEWDTKPIKKYTDRVKMRQDHCYLIYKKNDYEGLFNFTQLTKQKELDDLVMDEYNSLFYLRNFENRFPFGRTEFKEQSSQNLFLDKDYIYDKNNYYYDYYKGLKVGSFINFGIHDNGSMSDLGYSLAHELLHVLTIRGARILKQPQKYFKNDIYLHNTFHYDDEKNLLAGGRSEYGGPTPPVSPTLHPEEKIVPCVNYLVVNYLAWYYWRKKT